MDNQDSTLTIREYPLAAWIIGLVLLAVAGYTALRARGDWVIPVIAGVAGLQFIIFATILVVQANRIRGTLTIRQISPLRRYKREIPISNIARLQVESQTSVESEKDRGTTTTTAYRTVVITTDNETIPFRNAYTSGLVAKEAKAKRLREFLGVEGEDMSMGGMLNQTSSATQQAFQEKEESLSGPESEEHVTEGVHWKTQTVTFSGMDVTRWFSPDQQCTTGFVFLAQKVAGQAAGAGGLLGGLNKVFYHELMEMFGFGNEDTPGLDSAEPLPSFDPQLDSYFTVFTSDPTLARQYLTWSIAPLVDWATRHPLKKMQTGRGPVGQLVVMICPRGTYVASMGNLIPEAVQELANLGVVLVNGR